MCGIVFKHNYDKKKPVNNDILQQFDKQRSRGTRGFGVFDGQYMNIVRESREDNILKWLVKKDSNLILFHHRLPTSTVNVAKAAHPFSTKKYFGDTEYILVHNGIIRNAEELWVEHQRLKISYGSMLDDLTFNDSEALMWDIVLTLEGRQEKMKAYGDMAFIIMKKQAGKLVDMLYGRNSRPLNVKKTDEGIALSSEGEGVSILSNHLYTFNFKTHETTKVAMEFPQYKAVNYTHGVSTYPNSGFRQQNLLSAKARHESDDEYGSYDDWYGNKYGVKSATAGAPPVPKDPETNWQRLRRKYGTGLSTDTFTGETVTSQVEQEMKKRGLSSAGIQSIGQILDAKKNKQGTFIVERTHSDMKLDLDQINVKDYEPTATEIQNCAMEYMIENQGNFEDAYYSLEADYCEYADECANKETFEDVRNMLLFEKAMLFIEDDPEYKSRKSVSSMWAALWSQVSLA